MGVTPNFTSAELRRDLENRMQRIENAVLETLKRIGETFVRNARENGTYNDITGNLRSSVGYIILKNGVQIEESFGGKTGGAQAKKVASEVAGKFPRGYVLIVVAGMDYAAAVESRGRDVLTASSIIAKNDLVKAIASIKSKIPKMA